MGKNVRSIADFMTASVDDIIGESVVVTHAAFESRTAPDGKPYSQTVVTLADGSMYRSSSKVVADTFARIPDDGFPVSCKFVKRPSTRSGFQDFTAVEPADEDFESAE